MTRVKPGLGQGLEALVSRRTPLTGLPGESEEGEGSDEPGAKGRGWEFALLEVRRGKKRRKLFLTISHPWASVRPRQRRLRGLNRWTAAGILGSEGWELVSVWGDRFYFKRPIAGE